MTFGQSVHAKAIELVRLSLEMTAEAGSGHPTSAASLAHLVTVLMYGHMRYDPAEPDRRGSDRLILSEGHACPIVYAAAADLGMRIGRGEGRAMTPGEAMGLRAIESEIDGHPNPAEGFPFFPAATGSLGQGLSVAAGLALAARLDGSDARFFCLIGDGESREGQIREAVDFIVDHRLSAVCPVFNCNAYGQTGRVSSQQSPEALQERLLSAGMEARIIRGHEPAEIREALRDHAAAAGDEKARPLALVARTVKGWGMPSLQERNLHGKPVQGDELERARDELDATARRLSAALEPAELLVSPPPDQPEGPGSRRGSVPDFDAALERYGEEQGWQPGEDLATRKAYGLALKALGHADPRVVVLDGDVSNSTYSELFADDPELSPRYFECRIAEQNMISTALGLWAGGYIPFASTFGKFVTRAYDQLEMAILSRAGINVMGSHCGVSLAADGPSQMALADVSFFRSFSGAANRAGSPLCTVLQAADARAAYDLTLVMADHDGPCYLRTQRPDVPVLDRPEGGFHPSGFRLLTRGEDLLIVAAGYMVHEARKALPGLAEAGIRAGLVDLYALPFDEEGMTELIGQHDGHVLTVEDNYRGGIGSAVADVVAEAGLGARVRQMHVTRPPKSGRTPEDVLGYLSLSASDIVTAGTAQAATGAGRT